MLEELLASFSPLLLLGSLFAALISTIFVYLVYSGLFAKVTVDTKEPPFEGSGLTLAYKVGTGAYKNCGHLFTEASSILPTNKCAGIYYDDPETVPENELRYAVGSVINPEEEGDKLETMKKHGFRIAHLPKPEFCVSAEFPFRSTLSIYCAIFKVYPKFKEYISARGLCAYPAVELYDDNLIRFFMPLSKQDEWLVPEFKEDEVSIATTEMSTKDEPEDPFIRPKTPELPDSTKDQPEEEEEESPNQRVNGQEE